MSFQTLWQRPIAGDQKAAPATSASADDSIAARKANRGHMDRLPRRKSTDRDTEYSVEPLSVRWRKRPVGKAYWARDHTAHVISSISTGTLVYQAVSTTANGQSADIKNCAQSRACGTERD